jgi:uncharacterized membrane protein
MANEYVNLWGFHIYSGAFDTIALLVALVLLTGVVTWLTERGLDDELQRLRNRRR